MESPAPELVSVSRQGPGEGTTGGGFVREAQPLEVDLLSRVSAPECKASEEKKMGLWREFRFVVLVGVLVRFTVRVGCCVGFVVRRVGMRRAVGTGFGTLKSAAPRRFLG